jgi:hypothetical protein
VCEGFVQHDVNMEILFQAQAATQDPPPPAVCDVSVVVDVLCEVGDDEGGGRYTLFVRPYLDSESTHGTGCTLGAALACALAREEPRTYNIFHTLEIPLFVLISVHVMLQLSKLSILQRCTPTTGSPLHSRWAAAMAP